LGLTTQVTAQASKIKELDRIFFVYARQWWEDFLQIRASHATRLVKFFAVGEFGKRQVVTDFVYPIRSDLITNIKDAARFVSLLGFEHKQSIGEVGHTEIWHNMHTFLSSGTGEVIEHAVLLCNIFLGFFVDAYITMGTDKNNNAHTWVTTLDMNYVPTYWEPLSGAHYKQAGPHPFKTVGCCFNDKSFYANIQVVEQAEEVKFNLHESSKWKCMRKMDSTKVKINIPIMPFNMPNICDRERQIENMLKQYISDFRDDFRYTCVWDSDLAHILGIAIDASEQLKKGSISSPTNMFESAVKRCIPENHTFKV
jgi:centrosomal protein CEP76